MNNRVDAEKFYTKVRKMKFKEMVNQMYGHMVMRRRRRSRDYRTNAVPLVLVENDRMGKENGVERQTGPVAGERSDIGASGRHPTGRVRRVN